MTFKTETEPLGFADALGILFIGLKLAGVIDWHWLWVLSPIWVVIVIRTLIATFSKEPKP